MTPEGKVKAKITALLRNYEPDVWFTMPVPSGYGESTLDYIGCVGGVFFAIEAKKPGGKPTERQLLMMNKMELAGGKVFVVDGEAGLARLQGWIQNALREQGKGRSAPRSEDRGAVPECC